MEAAEIHGYLNASLEALRRAFHRAEVLRGCFIAGASAVLWFAAAVLADELLYLSPTVRTGLVIIGVTGSIGLAAYFIVVPALRLRSMLSTWSRDDAAHVAGRKTPGLADRLLDALEVYESRDSKLYSPELSEIALYHIWDEISKEGRVSFTHLVDREPFLRARRWFALSLATALLVAIPAPGSFLDALNRVSRFSERFAAPSPYHFSVLPGSREVLKGADVPVVIRVIGPAADKLVLHLTRTVEDQEDVVLQPDSVNLFRTVLHSLRVTTAYEAEVRGYRSDEYRLSVVDRPVVKNLRVLLTPPVYTKLSPRYLDDNVGDISALPGTKASLEVASSKELRSAAIHFGDSTRQPMSISGIQALGSFQVNSNGSYHITLADTSGLPSVEPIEYRIILLPDEPPSVAVMQPGRNTDLGESMQLPLAMTIKDDFGFSKLRIGYRLIHSKYERPWSRDRYVDVPLSSTQGGEQSVEFVWDLTGLNLVPEDALQYYAEIFDNDVVRGPKSGRSESYVVRLASLEEIIAGVNEEHKNISGDLEQAKQEAEKIEKAIKEVNQEFLKNQKLDWQNQKKLENVAKRYDELKKELQKTAESLDQVVRQMNQNQLLSPQTLEKYMELQKLMSELNSPELQQALQKMQQAMQNMNPDALREAMKNLTFSEEQFRQSIERTMNLLKRIQIEQKVDEMKKRAEELKRAQDELKKAAEQTNPSDAGRREELARKQADIESRLKTMEQELGQLKSQMEEFPGEMPLQLLSKAQERLSSRQVAQKMWQARQNLQSGNMQQAQGKQQEASEALSEFQQAMDETQKALQENQKKEIVNKLRKAINDVLTLSQREENLKNDTRSLDPNSQRFRDAGREQANLIGDLGNVVGNLLQLSQKTFAVTPQMGKELGKAFAQMNRAMTGLESRNGVYASEQQGAAMAALNRAASIMDQSLKAMMQGGGQGGMQTLLQQLQQMAGQQMGINAMTREMQQQAMSMEQAARMARLAAQQGAVQKSLEQLAEEAKRSGQREKLLGDLEKVAQEMQEVVKNLENRNVSNETIQRQDRILSRLLDATRSVHERDFEKKRVAETGQDVQRQSPAELNLQKNLDRLQNDLLKAREEGYSRDYQDLIRRYYESLQKAGVKPQ